jgi:hypothetical protein
MKTKFYIKCRITSKIAVFFKAVELKTENMNSDTRKKTSLTRKKSHNVHKHACTDQCCIKIYKAKSIKIKWSIGRWSLWDLGILLSETSPGPGNIEQIRIQRKRVWFFHYCLLQKETYLKYLSIICKNH